MRLYTVSSGVYRFFCGVVLLLVNWHIAATHGGGYDMLAVSTTLSFLPAVLVPPLIRYSPLTGGARMTAAGLTGVAATLLLIDVSYSHIRVLVALNFVLWIFFFFLESTWEIWFNDEASGLDGAAVGKYSSSTITVNQVALMVGPLFAPLFVRLIHTGGVFAACSALFAATAAASARARGAAGSAGPRQERAPEPGQGRSGTFYLLAFMLIWPILGTFNFMLPLQVLHQGKSMFVVGVLDALLGVGMAVTGIVLNRLAGRLPVSRILGGATAGVAAAVAVWLLVPVFGPPQMAAVFILGCAFGALRVVLRAEAAVAFSPRRVGAIVANANACSLLLLTAVLAGGRFFPSHIWLAPFALTLLLVLAFSRIRRSGGRDTPLTTEVEARV